MLRTRHLYLNRLIFYLLAKLCIIPVTFDPLTGHMKSTESFLTKLTFKGWQTFFFCHSNYIKFRTIQAVYEFNHDEESVGGWEFIPIMLIGIVTFDYSLCMSYFMFDKGRDVVVKIYNEILGILGETNEKSCHFIS